MDIKALVEASEDYIIERRRYYHAHPEVSMKEYETTKAIAADLEALGIEHKTFLPDHTGVIGEIHGGKPGKTIMLRADIDGLTVQEQTGLPFASENPGIMHACGHDCHISTLLGAAKVLNEIKDELPGNVRLVFEPGEETLEGVHFMLRDGCLDGVDAVYGMHVWSAGPKGKVSVMQGNIMAAGGMFTCDIEGYGAHGASPHDGKDAIVAAGSVIMNLQTYVSRRNNPVNPLVVTIGTIEGGNRWNIIANHVHMEGTLRTFDPVLRKNLQDDLSVIVENTAKAFGCTGKFEYHEMWPATINSDTEMIDIARKAAVKLYGDDVLLELTPTMGGESFSYYLNERPGCYAFMGTNCEENPYGNHNEKYSPDESLVPADAALFAQVAWDYLNKKAE